MACFFITNNFFSLLYLPNSYGEKLNTEVSATLVFFSCGARMLVGEKHQQGRNKKLLWHIADLILMVRISGLFTSHAASRKGPVRLTVLFLTIL
jgi:hypothetical protein